MREFFQAGMELLQQYPLVALVILAFVYFVLLDVQDAFNRPKIINRDEDHYTQKDARHGQNRRGEGMED